MTTEEYIAKQRAKLEQIRSGVPLEIAARDSMTITAHRIFVDGLNTEGGEIGQYNSTTPFYIDPNYSPRASANKAQGIKGLQRKGKTGESKFKNGKEHKTSWQKSYKDFKANIGQKNDKVRPHLSGDLESDFRNAPIDSQLAVPKKVNNNEFIVSLTRDYNAGILQGLENKFGSFVSPSKNEEEVFRKSYDFQVRRILAQ